MIDVFLLPEATVVTSNGDSAPVDISGAEHRIFLINVSVTAVIEQQSVELSRFYLGGWNDVGDETGRRIAAEVLRRRVPPAGRPFAKSGGALCAGALGCEPMGTRREHSALRDGRAPSRGPAGASERGQGTGGRNLLTSAAVLYRRSVIHQRQSPRNRLSSRGGRHFCLNFCQQDPSPQSAADVFL